MGITYYVSASEGNNNNPGNAPDKPFRTIQAGINKAQAGDTIVVRGGTYAERLLAQKPGTADAPIVISAYENEQPVIDGASLSIPEDEALVAVQQSQDLTLNGLIIRNASGRGMAITRSSRITIRNCTIESCYSGGFYAGHSDTVLIEKCRIHDCARRFLAYGPERLNVALLLRHATSVTIQENHVYENSDEGITVALGCKDVKIRKNVCYDNRNGQIGVISSVDVAIDSNLCYHTGRREFLTLDRRRGPGITKRDLAAYRDNGSWHTRNVKITNNIIVGCGAGFEFGRRSGKLQDFIIAHNTVVNSTDQAIKLTSPDASTQAFIENNLFAAGNDSEMAQITSGQGIVWRHNLWSAFPGALTYNPASDVIEADAGLVNMNATVKEGVVTADPYKLREGSVAINRGVLHNGEKPFDFWGIERDAMPDLGAHEFPNGTVENPTEGPPLPEAGTRVTEGLVALYDFRDGRGKEIKDVGKIGSPLNLSIKDESRVSWTDAGLEVKEAVQITSEKPASKIINACRSTGEITLEAWIRPANLTQDGPARIISISGGKTRRNVTLGQGMHGANPADLYIVRLRTTSSSANGLPAVITPPGSATQALTHVVYTRTKDGRANLYVNGQDRGLLTIGGDLSNWSEEMPLLLADEKDGDRPWLGLFRLVAFYSRALRSAEVLHNYEAETTVETPVTAGFSILPGDETGVAPHVVEFDSVESVATSGIAGYFWEFGDGQTSDKANPVHTYTTPGTYTVSLTITDKNGASGKVTKDGLITVSALPIPPLPADYARFILVEVSSSTVKAFGNQFPDLRCSVMWNEPPHHMLMFTDIDDVLRGFGDEGSLSLVWVDKLEIG